MKQAYNMHPPTATLREINISQTQVKIKPRGYKINIS